MTSTPSPVAFGALVRFGPLEIEYDERVLVPRPWTVMHSEWVAELSPQLPPGPILELCAGAGQIGLLAAHLTGRPAVQVEVDPVAAAFAAGNATRNRLDGLIEVRCARMENALSDGERFPLIVADPPYLRTTAVGRFPHDPRAAIDGGPDGLDVLRSALEVAVAHLAPGGVCLLQVAGAAQAEMVAMLPEARRLTLVAVREADAQRAVMLLSGPGDAI